jgi:hypothetical protein
VRTVLRQADRIGDGHQQDLAPDVAARVGLVQQPQQMVRDQNAGQLVGVQGGVDVDLGPRPGGAVAVQLQRALRARLIAGRTTVSIAWVMEKNRGQG